MTPYHKKLVGNRKELLTCVESYGVSSNFRVLTKGLFFRRYHNIRTFLRQNLGLTIPEAHCTMKLLYLWAQYGKVFPKVSLLCEEPGCSQSTAWRTIARLEKWGLVERVNMIMIPVRGQISNLYLLRGLLIHIARYLAEHGQKFTEKRLRSYLAMSGKEFWTVFAWQVDVCSLPAP